MDRRWNSGVSGWRLRGGELVRMQVSQDVRFLKSVGKHEWLVAEQLVCRSVGHDRPLVQYDRPAAKLNHHLQVVSGDDFGCMN